MLHALPRRLGSGVPSQLARLAAAASARARAPAPPHAAPLSASAAAHQVAMPPMGDPSKGTEVLVEDLGCMRAAVMHRPGALNAINHSMVDRLAELYDSWAKQPHVRAVVLKGAGGRAFCAGGDVRALAAVKGMTADERAAKAIAYFRAEDTLVYRIATYPKPHVAIMDGIVMGGGAGVSINGALRVATERSVFAMPEAVIGFFPDVGASHFLNRLPGRLGVCAALTGLRLRGRELRDVGLATHYVESSALPLLMERLTGLDTSAADVDAVSAALREHEAPAMLSPPPAGSIPARQRLIDSWFAGDTVEQIDAALSAAAAGGGADGDFAAGLRAEMGRAAPTALKVSLEALRRARGLSLRECLLMEFRVVARFMARGDFYEGVRAALVDKDGEPRWAPATLDQVTPADVAAFFEPLPPDQELQLGPEPGAPPPRARL